jgi:hypothetical protein
MMPILNRAGLPNLLMLQTIKVGIVQLILRQYTTLVCDNLSPRLPYGRLFTYRIFFSVRHTIRLLAHVVLQLSKFKVLSFPRCLINERKFTIPVRNLLNDKVHLPFFQNSKIGFVDLFSFLFDIYFPVLRLRMN